MNNLVRSESELQLMRESGRITATILQQLIAQSLPGVNLLEIESLANQQLVKYNADASFKSVPDYLFATCLNLNAEVVHGLPRDIVLKSGDILKIDFGALYKNWHTDAAWTILVSDNEITTIEKSNKTRFLQVGEEALWKAVKQAKLGNHIGDISSVIQQTIELAGLNVVRSYCGHGVGKAGHEEPEVPTFGNPNSGIKLEAGMTLAIEAIYTNGSGSVKILDDGWTVASADGTMSALFEMTVIVTDTPEVITDWRKIN